MTARKILKTSSSQGSNQSQSKFDFVKLKENGLFRVLVSGLAASIVYFFFLNVVVPYSAADWARHLITLGASLLLFAFIGFSQKEKGDMADSIITFLVLLYGLSMAICYL